MSYSHFTIKERNTLQSMRDKGANVISIAEKLDRHASSIYREISRNTNKLSYCCLDAEEKAKTRRRDSTSFSKRGNQELMKTVNRLFEKDLSPEQIAGRLRLERPKHKDWHISHETIYQSIYDRIKSGENLRSHLRHGHQKRRKRLSGKDKRGIIPGRIFIDKRPAIVEKKTRRGDWEGDTVEGAKKKGYVGTFVDRKSKYLLGYPLAKKTSKGNCKKAIAAFKKIPADAIETITVDNGKEFAEHLRLAKETGAKVYFAHPYHSWERGLNEHTNGLLRQYLPKKMSLENLTEKILAKIIDKINNRPRKSLGYRTPREVFFKLPLALQT
jgi:IS30 family transposase